MKKWFTALWTQDGIQELSQPDELYYADPFIIDGFLFAEEYDQKKGVIVCRPVAGGEWKKVIEEPYHLSFPCVFKEGTEYYIVPESGINFTVDLYKAVEFPYSWVKWRNLLQGKNWADPVMYFSNNRWYLFVTPADNTLEIYRSETLGGEFQRIHSDDHMQSRSAGKLFEMDGKLIRPVQNGDPVYGTGIILKEITIEPYTERVVGEIKADWADGLLGTHTINSDGEYVVIDGKREATMDKN
jgi:hypothetical protein